MSMSVRVRLPALFADRIGGVVDTTAPTVEAALREVGRRYPALATLVLASDGRVNPVIVVFLNDQQLPADRLGAPVRAGDEIDIVPAIEGG